MCEVLEAIGGAVKQRVVATIAARVEVTDSLDEARTPAHEQWWCVPKQPLVPVAKVSPSEVEDRRVEVGKLGEVEREDGRAP